MYTLEFDITTPTIKCSSNCVHRKKKTLKLKSFKFNLQKIPQFTCDSPHNIPQFQPPLLIPLSVYYSLEFHPFSFRRSAIRLLPRNLPAYRPTRKVVIDYTHRPRAEILRLVWIYRAIKMPASAVVERVQVHARVRGRETSCICKQLYVPWAAPVACWWKSRRRCTEGNRIAVI